ncbi:hypothetical protein [Streptomyces sp. enrichment culture]|uniref:hypothetical protein n=1 Tax=Streptomyces sp. enrichment culture TaxID=1795815 RepID=UPI003F5549BE
MNSVDRTGPPHGPDAVGTLLTTLEPDLPSAVDELQIATLLERRGLTDEEARSRYGQDVFDLSRELFLRLPARPHRAPAATAPPTPRAAKLLAHGPLYAVPSLVYPAVLVALGGPAMVRGMLLATTLGWVWGMGTSVAAYRLLGQGRPRAAARLWRRLTLLGLGLAVADAALLATTGDGGRGLVAFVVAQVGYQLASGTLLFYGMEARLALIALPAAVLGVTYILLGFDADRATPTLIAGAATSALALGAAWWATRARGEPAGQARPDTLRPTLTGTLPCVGYAMLSALFLMFNSARFITAPLELAITVAPLVLGMGVLEWRSHRFHARAVALLHRTAATADFRRGAWRLLLRELGIALLALAVLGALLVGVLAAAGILTSRSVVLLVAYLLLGGAYFAGYILVNHGEFRWVLTAVGTVVVLDIAATLSLSSRLAPYGEVPVFLAGCLALLALFLTALRLNIGRVAPYR